MACGAPYGSRRLGRGTVTVWTQRRTALPRWGQAPVRWRVVVEQGLAPVITSAGAAAATVGTAFAFTVTATNAPTAVAAVGLPAGLAINAATGAITGTPTAAGVAAVTLSASNAYGTGTATLTLTVAAAPTVTVANAQFDAWTTGTSTTFAYTGVWTPATVASPDAWTTTPPTANVGGTVNVSRQAYTTGSGADAGVHGAFVCRLSGAGPSPGANALRTGQSVAIPAGAAGHALTVQAWVRYGYSSLAGSSTFTGATLALGASSAADASFNPATGAGAGTWVLLTVNVPSSHTYGGTNQTLLVAGLPTFGNAAVWVEVAAVRVLVV